MLTLPLPPGTPSVEDQAKIQSHPFSAHINSSALMKVADDWCKSSKIDVHYGLPNPMYWLFETEADRDAFVSKGFGTKV